METKDLKNIWKSGADKNTKPYSDSQLSEMVIRSAQKSIRRVYPSIIFLLISVAVTILLIVNISVRDATVAMRLLDLGALLILVISLTSVAQSFSAMRRHEMEMPIRNWLDFKIKEVEKSLNFSSKYFGIICVIALLCGLGYFYFFIWFSNISYNLWLIGSISLGVLIFILRSQRSVVRKYKKTLDELKELYKQLEGEDL